MVAPSSLDSWSRFAESLLCPPFEWRHVEGGRVVLEDATRDGGTTGGVYQVHDFAIAKYPITNDQYEKFLNHSNGFSNSRWWEYSPEALQWRKDHKTPKPTAFKGSELPRTRISWFDSMAFCLWLSFELKGNVLAKKILEDDNPSVCSVRLPTEQEWQRAALGDSGWYYPWGNDLDQTRANYGGLVGKPSRVGTYPAGKSIYGVMDLAGNVWEWCLTGWNQIDLDVRGYRYRIIKGGAWNISDPEHLRAIGRASHPPRGRLNDCGFRVVLGSDPQQPMTEGY